VVGSQWSVACRCFIVIVLERETAIPGIRCKVGIVVAGVALVATAAGASFKNYFLAQNFHAIEPGSIYRGAEQKAGPLRGIIERHGIRTIVCLVDPEPDERMVAESLGVTWFWLPLGDSSLAATFDTLEKLATILADPDNQPVFYHCRRGVYRSNLAHAVYRMKSCGWTLDQALEDLRRVGFDPETSGGDNCCVDVLRSYYEQRILARDKSSDKHEDRTEH
jgi:protein tyrosine phosphatase (PTP) superfamily phosphohydrolase (DUF442 family)